MRRMIVFVVLLSMSFPLSAGMLDDYVAMRSGTFSSAAQAARDTRYDVAIWHVIPIWPGNDDAVRWLYVEAWLDEEERPYMQRIASVRLTDAGEIESRRFRIDEAQNFLAAERDPTQMPARESVALRELPGCKALLVAAGHGRFEGGTLGKRCKNRYKGAEYAVSSTIVEQDRIVNWDRGFDAVGRLVWGPQHGGYELTRVGAEKTCSQPVRMLVHGVIHNREAFGGYARAIAASNLYEQTGGYYEALSPPIAVFEGKPPRSRGIVIARFPCLDAARDFWYSDTYQNDIRPLREGISEFEVVVLDAPPLPDYLH